MRTVAKLPVKMEFSYSHIHSKVLHSEKIHQDRINHFLKELYAKTVRDEEGNVTAKLEPVEGNLPKMMWLANHYLHYKWKLSLHQSWHHSSREKIIIIQ